MTSGDNIMDQIDSKIDDLIRIAAQNSFFDYINTQARVQVHSQIIVQISNQIWSLVQDQVHLQVVSYIHREVGIKLYDTY
jgi:hypothetical protein